MTARMAFVVDNDAGYVGSWCKTGAHVKCPGGWPATSPYAHAPGSGTPCACVCHDLTEPAPARSGSGTPAPAEPASTATSSAQGAPGSVGISCPAFLVVPGEHHRPCRRESGHLGYHLPYEVAP